MSIVEEVVASSGLSAQLDSYKRDSITLTWEQRRQGHGRRSSDSGIEFAISLPSGTILKAGDYFILDAEKMIIAVKEAQEAVYVIRPQTPQEWAYYAFHAGNRHQSVMIGEAELVFLQNPAIRSLLDQLRARYTTGQRSFTAALAGNSHR